MKRLGILFFFLYLAGAGQNLSAHELRPGYLEIRENKPETYQVMWKVPAKGSLRLSLNPQFPNQCNTVTPRSTDQSGMAFIDRWTLTCPGGLSGEEISIEGLSQTLTDVLVRIEKADGSTLIQRLTPDSSSFVVSRSPSPLQVIRTYLTLGVEHILSGIDHLLFVLALLILIKGTKRLVWAVTAFTVAHSITLAAATLGFVHVPQAPVEAIIALSIIFVASEILHGLEGRPGITQASPWIVAFVFGLLHGFGFAGALTEIGLPQQSVPLALLFFNVGVEVGQILFIAVVGLLALGLRSIKRQRPQWMVRVPAYGIGGISAFWFVERIVGFWN